MVQQPGQHQGVHLVGVDQPPVAGGKTRVGQLLPLHDLGYLRPPVVRPGDDAHVAVAAGIDAPGGPPVAPVADPGELLAGVAVLHQSVFQDVGAILGDGDIDMLALAGLFGVEQGGHGGRKGVLPGAQLGQGRTLFQRLQVGFPGDVHQAAGGIEVDFGSFPVPVGAGLPIVGDGCHHQGRVLLAQVLIP